MNGLTGQGCFFDGRSARPVPVSLRVVGGRLEVLGPDLRRDWNGLDLRADDAEPPLMRVGPVGEAERVEFADAMLATALEACCPDLRTGPDGPGGTLRVVLWSAAAGLVLLGLAVFGVPVLADVIAPLVPPSIEARLGAGAEGQIVRLLGDPPLCAEPEGQAVLDRLASRLGAGLPANLHVSVRRSQEANALALPGGRIVILSGVLDRARNPDEFAGVLGHEIGHVAARDSIRALIRNSGFAFVLSYLTGDVTGSALIVALGQAVVSASHSREAERAADAYAVAALARAGGDATAPATILERIAADRGQDLAFLRSHPFTRDRAAAIRAQAAVEPTPSGARLPLLSAADWTALKAICTSKAP